MKKHQWDKSDNGDWACRNCHRWMGAGPKYCNPAKERERLRRIVQRAMKRS